MDVVTDYGVTSLMTACSNKSLDQRTVMNIVQLLLEYGADFKLKDYRNRRTALQVNTTTTATTTTTTTTTRNSNNNNNNNGLLH